MLSRCGSLNYVWFTNKTLGSGSTANVYEGVNNKTGEPVAVKVFNRGQRNEVLMREFDVLKKVNHENIVKLLAIEEDQEGRGKVIVMELCTGGSLLNILDDPENSYGLPEKEFLLVLEHLCAGRKYLRDNKVVHRDLKPGNIMKFVSEDGQTIYKLTDFGFARELEDNESFKTICGTEEYLHPDFYERAVLRKSINRSFTADVELWSIGVTLYHITTGNLPFRPYGGRKNRETMHQITTKKSSGVISGIQQYEDGPIEWSKTLPSHCHLSEGLKALLTPMLAGLLEANPDKSWSFDRYFEEVTLILRKKIIHAFYINESTSIEVFLEPDEQIDNLQERIYLQTGVPQDKQILLFNNEHLEGLDKSYPETTIDNPVFLYSYDDNNIQLLQQLKMPKFPVFPTTTSVHGDIELSKEACSVAHEYKRRVEICTSVEILMNKGATHFNKMLTATITSLLQKCNHFDEHLNNTIEYADVLKLAVKLLKSNHNISTLITTLNELKQDFDRTADSVKVLNKQCILQPNDQWRIALHGKNNSFATHACKQAENIVNNLRNSWDISCCNRDKTDLSSVEEQYRTLEKIKINRNIKRIQTLLDDVKLPLAQITEPFGDWFKLAQTVYLKTQILEKDVDDCNSKFELIRTKLHRIKSEMQVPENKQINTIRKGDMEILMRETMEILQQFHELTLKTPFQSYSSNK